MRKWEVSYTVKRVVSVKKGDDEDALLDAACDEIVKEVRSDVGKCVVGWSCVTHVKQAKRAKKK